MQRAESGLRAQSKKLSQLFRLKYQRGICDRKELAERLGVSVKTVYSYESKLKKRLLQKIRVISPERLEFVCPECLEARVFHDPETGEKVCMSCGYVLPSRKFDSSLPFDTTYALSSHLAAGKSLGGTISKTALYKVLAKANGAEDLGLRARQIRVITETNEHPTLIRLLKMAYQISKRFNLESDKLFNNDLGRNIRRVFWLTRELELTVSLKTLAETVFWFTLCQYGKHEIARQTQNTLTINPTLLNLNMKLHVFLRKIARENTPINIIQLVLKQKLAC